LPFVAARLWERVGRTCTRVGSPSLCYRVRSSSRRRRRRGREGLDRYLNRRCLQHGSRIEGDIRPYMVIIGTSIVDCDGRGTAGALSPRVTVVLLPLTGGEEPPAGGGGGWLLSALILAFFVSLVSSLGGGGGMRLTTPSSTSLPLPPVLLLSANSPASVGTAPFSRVAVTTTYPNPGRDIL